MPKTIKPFGFAACLALIACAAAAQVAPVQSSLANTPSSAPSAAPSDYRLGPGDVVQVAAYGTPEFNRTLSVGVDGEVSASYLKTPIAASNDTADELSRAISGEILSEQLLVDPQIEVTVLDARSHAVAVGGAVHNPTVLYLDRPITLLDAILRAGGVENQSAGATVMLTVPPKASGEPGPRPATTREIPYSQLTSSSDPALNPILNGGEQVAVLPGGEVYVSGGVKKPGGFPLLASAPLTASRAIALAEGIDDHADGSKAVIMRTTATGDVVSIPVDLKKVNKLQAPDPPLVANDVIYVPVNDTRRAAMYLGGALTTTAAYILAFVIAH